MAKTIVHVVVFVLEFERLLLFLVHRTFQQRRWSFWFPNLSTGPTNEAKYSVLSRCTCPKYLNKWWEMSVSCREGPTLGRLSGLTSPVVTQHAAGMFRLRLSPHLWFRKTRLSWMPVCLWPGRREDAKQSNHRPWFCISLLPPTPQKTGFSGRINAPPL